MQESIEIYFDPDVSFDDQVEDLISTLRDGSSNVVLDAEEMTMRQIETINKRYGLLLRECLLPSNAVSCASLTLRISFEMFELREMIAMTYAGQFLKAATSMMFSFSYNADIMDLISKVVDIIAWFIPICFCFVEADGGEEWLEGSSYMNHTNEEDFDILERRFVDSENKKQELIFQRWVKLFDKWLKEEKQERIDKFFDEIGVGE